MYRGTFRDFDPLLRTKGSRLVTPLFVLSLTYSHPPGHGEVLQSCRLRSGLLVEQKWFAFQGTASPVGQGKVSLTFARVRVWTGLQDDVAGGNGG